MLCQTLPLCLFLGKYWGNKKKKAKKNYFFMFGCIIENIDENKIELKLVTNLWIFKLFNVYIKEIK